MTETDTSLLPERPIDRALAQLGETSIGILRTEQPALFQDVVKAFDGERFDVALFGEGKFHVSVHNGEVQILPYVMGSAVAYRVGGYPSAVADIAEGRLTPLEAFFRAVIVAFGSAKDLSVGHAYIVKLAKFVRASRAMQELVGEFKALCKV